MEIYADELSSRGDAEESGILYSLAGKHELALEAYMKGLLWQEAFALAADMSLPQDKLKQMAFEMRGIVLCCVYNEIIPYSKYTDELVDQKRFKEAAEIMLEYGKSIEVAIEILAKGTYWSESVRLAKQSKRVDMLDSVIMPAAVKALDGMRVDVSEMHDTFTKQKLRLAEVRIKKEKQKGTSSVVYASVSYIILLEALKNGVPDERLENIDIMSDTSSMATTFLTGSTRSTSMSARSNRTGKQRRKNERRRAAGKMREFEDEYLITSLRKAIEKSNKMRGMQFRLMQWF